MIVQIQLIIFLSVVVVQVATELFHLIQYLQGFNIDPVVAVEAAAGL